MKNKQIAAKIYLINQEVDSKLFLLNVLNLTQGEDIEKILNIYEQIKAGELLVASIKSSIKLLDSQKELIENKLNAKYEMELIHIYQIEKLLDPPLQIMIGDDYITFTPKFKKNEDSK